jgi:hypothetical protein
MFLPLCTWQLEHPAGVFSLCVAELNEAPARTCLLANSHQLVALCYSAASDGATQPSKEVLLQLAHPFSELQGQQRPGGSVASAGLLERDLRYDHRIIAIDFVQRVFRSPLIVVLVSRSLRLTAVAGACPCRRLHFPYS